MQGGEDGSGAAVTAPEAPTVVAPLPLGTTETTVVPGATISDQWEIDVYSR